MRPAGERVGTHRVTFFFRTRVRPMAFAAGPTANGSLFQLLDAKRGLSESERRRDCGLVETNRGVAHSRQTRAIALRRRRHGSRGKLAASGTDSGVGLRWRARHQKTSASKSSLAQRGRAWPEGKRLRPRVLTGGSARWRRGRKQTRANRGDAMRAEAAG